jgi:hypothetical protein
MFDQVMDACSQARKEGIINVFSSYEDMGGQIVLGAIPMGEYPLNPRAMLWIYRTMARDNNFLLTAISNDSDLLKQNEDWLAQISVAQCAADGGINDDPGMPLIDGDMARPELREPMTLIARGRLACILKTVGYCAAKNLVPFFSRPFQHELTQRIVANATQVIDAVAEHDPYWAHRSQVLRLAHDEFLDEVALEELSVTDVIKLRSKIWGQQAEARDELMQSVAAISREVDAATDFEKACGDKIRAYKAKAGSLEKERQALRLKIKCDIGIGVGGVGTAIGAGSIAQVQTAIGAATTLLAGGVYALQKIKEYSPVVAQLRAAEDEFKDSAGFGLHQFYKALPSGARRR